MAEEKRVLHVLVSKVYGGAENVVCQIMHMFREDPDVKMFYCSPDGSVRPSLEERGVDFYPVRENNLADLKKVIRDLKPTVIHAHDMRAAFLVSLVHGNVPFVCTVHNNNVDSRGITPKSVLFRLAAGQAKHIFWVSRSCFEGYRFHRGLQEKSSLLFNVIDTEQVIARADAAPEHEHFDFMFIGRLTYQKNPQRVAHIMAEITRRRPGLKCAIAGIGELEQEVADTIAREGAAESVKMLGFQSNPCGILRDCCAMLMASRWEGTPMCALESMTLGTPIVTTPADGLCDLIDPGTNGYLAQSDEELVEACLKLADDPALRSRFSADAAGKLARMMDIGAYKKRLSDAYFDTDEVSR